MNVPQPAHRSTQPFKVLVVEDDPFFIKALEKSITLTIPNGEVDVYRQSHEATDRVKPGHAPYALAIIDLQLPDGDGIDVIRHITQTHPKTFIMVMSVASDEKRVLQAVRAGATGYVVKGDMSLSINKAIEQTLNGLHPISPSLAGYFLRLAGRESFNGEDCPIDRLTARELELLREFASGKSYQEAADTMKISITTVRTHTTNLYRKLGVRSSLRALSVAKEHGIL
ncbi:MAG TPA: response regulator transcription factor [Orrella sp.]